TRCLSDWSSDVCSSDLDPSELDSQVTARVPVRYNRDDRYFTDTFQAMPARGFTRMFENMLDHENIQVLLGADYRQVTEDVSFESDRKSDVEGKSVCVC